MLCVILCAHYIMCNIVYPLQRFRFFALKFSTCAIVSKSHCYDSDFCFLHHPLVIQLQKSHCNGQLYLCYVHSSYSFLQLVNMVSSFLKSRKIQGIWGAEILA